MCLLIAGLSRLCHASLNSRACLVFACPSTFVLAQWNLWSVFWTCAAGSDRESCRLIAFLCSVSLELIVFEVSPM